MQLAENVLSVQEICCFFFKKSLKTSYLTVVIRFFFLFSLSFFIGQVFFFSLTSFPSFCEKKSPDNVWSLGKNGEGGRKRKKDLLFSDDFLGGWKKRSFSGQKFVEPTVFLGTFFCKKKRFFDIWMTNSTR